MLYNNSPLAIYFTYGNMYVSTLLSIRPTLSSRTVSTSLFFTSVFLFLTCK